ncbi:hypothetical protein Niako_4185 [Niastella koreensis GR20-10]|uniref:Uncharacterized protein n=1 Tax=Niastella koreensis (strain DSM 17620 / KACC 11465 / NBRC 106392 / GR20-10) TaxID=700598 RepID=G8TDK9_NIAKG|nr:hypothetical protein Niako_4185 [Niastella koreensis GR20-10]
MPKSLEISRKYYNFNPDYCSLTDIQRLFDYDESIANAHLAGKPVMIHYRRCLRELPEKHLKQILRTNYVFDHLLRQCCYHPFSQ